MDMNTLSLRFFWEIAKSGSFSQAARKHYRTQPAVSMAIRRLEEELGVRLIERQGRRARLTTEGDLLKDSIGKILQLSDDLKFEASLAAKHPRGTVKVATIHSVGLYEISDTIKLFVKRYGNVKLDIQYDTSQKIYELVEEKEVDLGIVAYPRETNTVEVIPMTMDKMAVIASPTGDWARRSSVRLRDLNGVDFVAFAKHVPTRHAIDLALAQAGARAAVRFENENIETIKKAVEVGIGISIVPLKCIENEKRAGLLKVIRIQGEALTRPIGILRSSKYPPSKAAQFFVTELLKSVHLPRRAGLIDQ